MTAQSSIVNGMSGRDVRDTLNQALADIAALKAVTPSPTPSPTISFSTAATSIAEGDSGTKTVTNTINVARNGVTGALTISLAYSGTATSGVDYVAGPVSATIASGVSTASFDLVINGDTDVETDETIIIDASLSGYSATARKVITITNDDVTSSTGNILPTAALNDVAFGTTSFGSPYPDLGPITLPAGDWVMHIAVQLPTSNAYEQPIIAIAPSTVAKGYMNGNSQLLLNFMHSGTGKSTDPARGAFILSGKDDAGNWLSPNNNRMIPAYFTDWGTNVRYLAGPYEQTPDGVPTSIFIQKKNGRAELWFVANGATAVLHDYLDTAFGQLTGAQACLGRVPGELSRAAGTTFQRFFVAAGSLTAAQMEAISQGVDPRQYLPFNVSTDRLTNVQNVGQTAQPDLVGTGAVTFATSGNYTVKSNLIPNAVIADMPRAFIERNQVVQRSADSTTSNMYLAGRCTGVDDDIYVQVVDWSTKTTVVVPWVKVATSTNGVYVGAIPGVPSRLQWYDAQIRKGLNGTPYTINRRFGYGALIDFAGQSIAEELWTYGTATVTSGSSAAGFLSFFSRAKSNAGSTQGISRRGWVQSNGAGYGVTKLAQAISEALQCPVGVIMSAVKGSATDAWARGSASGYDPMIDTWKRTRPGFLVWSQGQGSTGLSRAQYMTFLDTFLQQTREDLPWAWNLIMEPLNNNGGAANSGEVFTTLRLAQSDWADGKAATPANRVTNAGNFSDLKLYDTVHPDPSAMGQGRIAERIARQVAFLAGAVPSSAMGPRITGVTRSGANLDVKVAHNGGTALRTPSTGDITGFEVSADNFATRLAFASSPVIVDATTIRIPLAADPGGPVKVRYLYGNPGTATTPLDANGFIPAVVNPLYDDRSPAVNTGLGFPVMFTNTDLLAA